DPVTAVFSIFPLVGIIMGYITLTMWVNKTTIKYSSGTLEILKGPLPWINSHVVVKGNNILQCWVEMYSSYTKNDVPVYSFRVKASRSRGRPLIIENGLRTYYEARVLEQWLENHLNIDDEYVPGEHVA
ncbi:MAG: hypothetical protein NXH75_17165, partial [Halobacteriovoraceae bacterium]|nr:hypothetical protein [Halobacteriovoraceae bacterium]